MALNVSISFPKTNASGLRVSRYELVDSVSELFELTLQIVSTDPELDMKLLIGEIAVTSFPDERFLKQVTGIVRRVRQLTANPGGASSYELLIVPPLWLTTRRSDNFIFCNQNAADLTSMVMVSYADAVGEPVLRLANEHPKHEYTVQYGETDYEFLFRILAEDGVTSFFAHDDDSKFVLLDDTTRTLGPGDTVPFVPASGVGQNTGDHISSIEISTGVEVVKTILRDFDFTKPDFTLESLSDDESSFAAEVNFLRTYEYGVGEFATDKDGKTLATRRREEARARRRVFRCEASFAVSSGMQLEIIGHPRDDVNGRVFVIRSWTVVEAGKDDAQRARFVFECTPADHPYRPPRRPKRRIHGTQTAMVVGRHKDVDEIDVDEHGRVRVHFHWDRTDPNPDEPLPTRFIRVSQGWAGAGFGFVMLPRVGDEVIVSYLDGDPDEPIIIGRVHNATSRTPLNLPEQKTRSTWRSRSSPGGKGYNEIMMEDKAGAELLELHAQRDFQHDTGHDSKATVGANQSVSVGANQSVSVGGAQSITADTNTLTARTIKEEAKTHMELKSGNTWLGEGKVVVMHGKTSHTIVSPDVSVLGTIVSTDADTLLILKAGTQVSISSDCVVDVTASEISISAKGTAEIKAKKVEVTGTGAVTVKGNPVDIKGGPVNITGSLIKLNC